MKQAPLKDRIDFYRYASATLYLDHARQTLAAIKETKRLTLLSSRMHGLWMTFYGLYAKPFKQQQDPKIKMGLRLSDDVIPPEFLEIHKSIIRLRDKVFIHTDFGSFEDYNDQEPNGFVISISDGRPKFMLKSIIPTSYEINKYEQLLDKLIFTVADRTSRIWDQWAKSLHLQDGSIWELNTSNEIGDVLVIYKHDK
jgi:hypothetical protein